MSQQQPKVSVVIPVYKVEPYIEKCVRTLFAQTLDSLEYIFVDDCSPDNSITVMQRVLEEFPNRKDQVKVIRHNPNEGVAKTRQDGIDAATGEYIIHCDPDDWVELDMYESMYNKAKETNADLVICDYYNVNGDKVRLNKQIIEEPSSISVLKGITGLLFHVLHGSTWNKMLRASCYMNVRIPSDVSYCEDVFLWCQILRQDLKIEKIDKGYYYYRANPNGLVSSRNKETQKKDLNLIGHYEKLLSISNNLEYSTCLKRLIFNVITSRFLLGGNMSSSEFSFRFKKYKSFITKDIKLGKINNLIVKMAFHGYRKSSRFIYRLKNKMYKLKYKILRSLINHR